MKNYTEEELEFIENTLQHQEDIEIVKGEDEKGKTSFKIDKLPSPRPKKKKNKTPAYKNPIHWMAAFIIAPVLLSAILMFLIFRVESMLGSGTLEWLANDPTGSQVKDAATGMGFEWLAPVITIYDNRWLIVAILFTVFFSIAILVIVYDNFIAVKLQQRKTAKQIAKASKLKSQQPESSTVIINDDANTNKNDGD